MSVRTLALSSVLVACATAQKPETAAPAAETAAPARETHAFLSVTGGHPHDLVHGVVHGLLQLDGRVMPVQPRIAVPARDPVVQPAAVAPRRPIAAELLLQKRDPQERHRLLQVVRRPQPGVAAADDAHVCGGVPGQRLAGSGNARLRVPE